MKKRILTKSLIELIFVVISVLTLCIVGIIFSNGDLYLILIELAISLLGISACFLNVKKIKYAFIIYAIYSINYGISAFTKLQYGEGILQACISFPLYLYTIYKLFLKNKNDTTFKIESIKKSEIIISIFFVIVFTIGYGFILKFMNSSYPFLNSLGSAFTLCGTYGANKRYKEQWIYWIFYSITLSILWTLNFINSSTGGIFYLIMNIIYFIVNIYALITRIQEERNPKIAHKNVLEIY